MAKDNDKETNIEKNKEKPTNFTQIQILMKRKGGLNTTSGTSGDQGGGEKDQEEQNVGSAMSSGTSGDQGGGEKDQEEQNVGSAKTTTNNVGGEIDKCTPVKIKVQRLEAGQFGHAGSKKNIKRKKTEQVLDTGQKRIVDFFIKKVEADLIRETADIKNQGAGNSPLLGASDKDAFGSSSMGGIKTQSEE